MLWVQEAEAKKEAELAAQMEAALEGDEDEEQRLIEERRKRRQQILAKHQQDRELSGSIGLLTPQTTMFNSPCTGLFKISFAVSTRKISSLVHNVPDGGGI